MLATKSPYPAPVPGSPGHTSISQYGSGLPAHRNHAASASSNQGFFASPTESEFSESYEVPDSVRFVSFFSLLFLCRWACGMSRVGRSIGGTACTC